MKPRTVFFFIGLLSASTELEAQDYKLELTTKASFVAIVTPPPAGFKFRYLPVPSLEMTYFIRPKLGVGVYYSRSLFANDHIGSTTNEFYSDDVSLYYLGANSAYHHYGIDVKLSTDRTRRLRIYGSAGILKAEQFIDFKDFKAGVSSIGCSVGFGTVLKVSRTIFLNLFDARLIFYNKDFSYDPAAGPTYGAKIDCGLIFKFIREK